MYTGPGIYRHYKGGHYRVLGVGKHESTGAQLVVYHSYSIEHDLDRWMHGVDFVLRPLSVGDGPDAFNEPVRIGEDLVERFQKVKP